MFKQEIFEYDSTAATPTSYWFPFDVAGYDSIVIQIKSAGGWDGSISFWGGPIIGVQTSPWSLNSAEDGSSTSVISNIVGATPTAFGDGNGICYRGSIAGLARFGMYFADPVTYASAVGIITANIGIYTSGK